MKSIKKVAAEPVAKKVAAKPVAKKVAAKPVAKKLTAAEKQARLSAGYAKQKVSLSATMALTDKDWVRGLVCLTGKNAGKVIKNPRRGWNEVKWFTHNQKTRLAKTLFDAAKKGEFPVYKLEGNEYQLAMGLSVAKRNKLQQVGEW